MFRCSWLTRSGNVLNNSLSLTKSDLPSASASHSIPILLCSEHPLYFYSWFDLILLVLNVLILTLPLIKRLMIQYVTKLTFIKCINQFNNWKQGQQSRSSRSLQANTARYYRYNYQLQPHKFQFKTQQKKKTSKSSSSTCNSISNSASQTSSSPSPVNDAESQALYQEVDSNNDHSSPCLSPANDQSKSLAISNRTNEIITQTIYILLFLLYLGYILELLILLIRIRRSLRQTIQDDREQSTTNHPIRDTSGQKYDIVSMEFVTTALTLMVHLFQYGVAYGHSLWLSSAAESLNTNQKHHQHLYETSSDRYYKVAINSIALVYFTVQVFTNFAKLMLSVAMFVNRGGILHTLLRPYLLAGICLFQIYFTFKHLFYIIRCIKQVSVPIDSTAKLSQVRYQRNQSTFLSMVTFSWFWQIIKLGYYKNLDLNDLGSLPSEEQAISQFDRFFKHYKAIDIHKNKSIFLWKVCWQTYKKSLIFGAVIKIFSDLSSLIGPMSIGYILNYISKVQNLETQSNQTLIDITSPTAVLVMSEKFDFGYLSLYDFFNNAYVMAIIVLVATLLQSTLSNNFNHLVISEGIHLKTALNCCIYNKALRMPVSNGGIDVGVISNYMSVDSSNIFQFFTMMHYLWSVPIKILILLYLLYNQMGISAIIGASIFFILSPFQYYCSTQISKIQKLQMNISDKRLSKTTELFMGIKLLKLLGWELSFADHIKGFRKTELDYLRKDAIFVAINTFITQGSAILVTMVTFSLFPYVENKPLTAATVFTSIALFNQITVPLYIVPLVIPMLVSSIVSHRRLVNYLSIRELKNNFIKWQEGPIRWFDSSPNSAPIMPNNSHRALGRSHSAMSSRPQAPVTHNLCSYIKSGKFAWYDEDPLETTLFGINVRIPRNKLTILVGSIGCGKSTLLASLIGETFLVEGELHWLSENSVSFGYVPSNPWILNVSLQENITFGRVYDRKRYEEVVKACCLQADIDLLPCGDQTVIGERGITLSGGQRQRIALARAIYSSAPTLILDDALSALDPIVGYSVFDNAIMRLTIKMQRRTVILATHKHEFLSNADYVVVIESGSIKNQGTLQQIEKEDKAFFYQWNVIKEKEIRERLRQKPQTCKTTEERHRLVRLLSKKGEFRGPIKREKQNSISFKRKPKSLCRQMSYDASNALPCHEWAECEDIIHESELEMTSSSSMTHSHFNRLVSSESDASKHSYLSLSSNSFNDGHHNSQTPTRPPTVLRINSRISNYSNAANSIIEEEEMDDQSISSDRDEDDYSPVEDGTNEVTNELLFEITSFNENQVENTTLYEHDNNPRNSQISLDVYLVYLKAHSYSLSSIVFGLIILNQAIRVVSDFWLAKWTDKDESLQQLTQQSHTNQSIIVSPVKKDNSIGFYIESYIMLSVISVIISFFTNLFAQLISIRAVSLLHDNLLETLVRCPLRFFDKTPIGRIMNRFTNDINVIDKKLPIAIPVLLRFIFLCLSAIIVNIIITPYFIIAIIPILVIYYYMQKIFRCTSRQLQRLELSSKSPIISHFNQTIDGLTTIRAFREQNMFCDKFYQLLDINNLCFLMVNSANCFLGISLDYLGGIILFIANLISITAALYWNVHSAFVGLAMTYTLLVPVYLNWLVRNLASVEMNMNSVERIYKYSQLDREESCSNRLKETDKHVPKDWPKLGEIEFKNVSIRYETNFEPIIRDANIHIKPGEKIGICGRTGSGKSSLISALFRINQIPKGKILIDGLDITQICPYKLRNRLSIIPQDLVLFTGSIRKHTDEELWKILKDFHLDKTITSLDEEIGDDSMTSNYEQRFSSGERQLLCCARAFLRNSSILIMDESTSLLDQKSELLVLEQIFKCQKTIIAIAHRVLNIANFDKVAVVNEGQVVEFDEPSKLLRNQQSIFYSLYHKQRSR